jgi:hypothetical protein
MVSYNIWHTTIIGYKLYLKARCMFANTKCTKLINIYSITGIEVSKRSPYIGIYGELVTFPLYIDIIKHCE